MAVSFMQILNMNITASLVILVVMAARLALKRFPKIYSYALWAVVLFRLLCPVSLSSALSVLDMAKPQVAQLEQVSMVTYEPVEFIFSESGNMGPFVREKPVSIQEQVQKQENPKPTVMEVASWVWLIGISIMVLHSAVTWFHLRRNLGDAVHFRGEVYLAERIDSPFVLGILRPRIYLPIRTPVRERRYIIAHERHHIRRGDHILKLLAYAALCLHWFNPLVWASFLLAGQDMEMSCDEAVIRRLGEQVRADYAESLLRLATGRKTIGGTPLAFGEGDTKGRVKNMAKWKKPGIWASVLCLFVCITVLAACAVNPAKEKDIGDMTRVTGPASCSYGGLNYAIPEGITVESAEAENFTKEELQKVLNGKPNRSMYIAVFKEGDSIVGGIHGLITPELTLTNDNAWQWVEALDVPEEVPEARFLKAVEMTASGVLSASYGSKEEVETMHYFYPDGNAVYDLWFDVQTASEKVRISIFQSAVVGGPSPVVEIDIDAEIRGSDIIYGDLTMTIPEDYTCLEAEDGSLALIKEGDVVAGITHWSPPAFALTTPSNMGQWAAALGIPEAQDAIRSSEAREAGQPLEEPIAYMIEGGGDIITAWFGNELYPEKLNRQHNLFRGERFQGKNVVYDVWYDENQLSDIQAEEFMKTVYIAGQPTSITQTDDGFDDLENNSKAAGSTIMTDLELYQKSIISDDGTVTIHFNIAYIPEQMEVENCLPIRDLLTIAEKEFRSANVDSYGFNTTAMGYVGATCELNITEIRFGEDYLISASEAVPTLEIWGERIYHFANGDQLGEEQGAIKLMLMNPQDGTILIRFGRKG